MIIDAHVHLFPPAVRNARQDFFSGEPEFKLIYDSPKARLICAEELIRAMDEEGVDKSVVFGFPWRTADNFTKHNDYILEAVQRYPARLIGFAALFPLAGGAPREVERCLQAGLSGIGELAFYTTPLTEDTCRACTPLAEIAAHHDVPLMLHANESIGHTYPGKSAMTLKELYDFLIRFSDTKIILAHWGGGLFFYRLMKKRLKEALRNTWFDTAASPFVYDPAVYAHAVQIVGPDRILFGSDFPLIRPGRYFEDMQAAGLSEETRQKICGLNTAALMSIKTG